MLAAVWAVALGFGLVHAVTLGEGVIARTVAYTLLAGLVGTLGVWWWCKEDRKASALTGLVVVLCAAWGVALALTSLVPGSVFVGVDARFGRGGQVLATGVSLVLSQAVLVGLLLGAAPLVRRLEGASSAQKAEDAVARRLHDALVPDVDVRSGPIAVWGRSVPCSNTGGDFIEVFDDAGKVTVVIGDVSGHGVGAGILMAMIKGALRVRLRQNVGPDRILSELNELVLGLNRPGVFVTATALRVHPDGRVECASAGHLPTLRLNPANPRGSEIANESLPLGVESEERFVLRECTLVQGETLALLTDGLTEVQDRSGRQIGMPLIRKALASRLHAPLPEIFATLASRCEAFGRQTDDQTLVLVRFGERPPTLEPIPTPLDEWEEPVAREGGGAATR